MKALLMKFICSTSTSDPKHHDLEISNDGGGEHWRVLIDGASGSAGVLVGMANENANERTESDNLT